MLRALLGAVVGMFDEPSKCGLNRMDLVALEFLAISPLHDEELALNSQGACTPVARLGLLCRRGRLLGGVRGFLHERHASGAPETRY
jgi:hypothetical protein